MARGGSVLAPDGRRWRVRRQWGSSWRVRVRPERDWLPGNGEGWGDLLQIDDITPAGIVLAAALVVLGLFLTLVVWPVIAIAIELVIFVALLLGAVVARVLFRRPWRVVARAKGPPPVELAWEVVGWRASGRACAEVTEALAAGDGAPRPASAEPIVAEAPVASPGGSESRRESVTSDLRREPRGSQIRRKDVVSYSIPILLLLLVVTTAVIVFLTVSRRSATADGKGTPIAHDARTPLGATDEGSDAPPSGQRAA